MSDIINSANIGFKKMLNQKKQEKEKISTTIILDDDKIKQTISDDDDWGVVPAFLRKNKK